MDEAGLEELAADIGRCGVKVPLYVKPVGARYEVIYGHRRLLASIAAKLAAVPCLVWDESDGDPLIAKLHENLGREDLSPAEEAILYAELLSQYNNDVDKVSELTKQRGAHIEARIGLFSGYQRVFQAMTDKKIGVSVATSLNQCHREKDADYLLDWAIVQGATARVVSGWVQQRNALADFEATQGPPADPLPDPEPVPATQQVCFICKSAADPYDFEFHFIHKSCRRMVEAQAARQSDRGSA